VVESDIAGIGIDGLEIIQRSNWKKNFQLCHALPSRVSGGSLLIKQLPNYAKSGKSFSTYSTSTSVPGEINAHNPLCRKRLETPKEAIMYSVGLLYTVLSPG
jgi:hypothetical protein